MAKAVRVSVRSASATVPAPRDVAGFVGVHLGLAVLGIAMVLPLVWAIVNSFKSEADIVAVPPSLLPSQVTLENYVTAFRVVPIGRAYVNSAIVTVSATLGTLLTSSFAAFAFARLRFRGRGPLFFLVLASMMIPLETTLIPSFVLFQKIGWLDTFWPLIVPPALTNGFGVFLLRQFFRTLPQDYDDAARIDGANPLQIYWLIALPLIKPALAALAIFAFVANWNSFLGPLIYINNPEKFTLPLVISAFRNLTYVDYGAMLATATLSVIPILVLYAAVQRYFIEGITMTGLRG